MTVANRKNVDALDLNINPTDTLLNQIELNREFIEHMLAKPEGNAEPQQKEGNNDD